MTCETDGRTVVYHIIRPVLKDGHIKIRTILPKTERWQVLKFCLKLTHPLKFIQDYTNYIDANLFLVQSVTKS